MQIKTEFLLKSYPDEHIMASIRRYPQHNIYFGSAEEQYHISFADLELKAQQLAATLRHKLGLKKGDVIAVLLPRTADFVISFYAIWLAGLIFMPLSNEWSNPFIVSRIKQSAAKCVIIDIRNASKIDQSEYQNVHFLTLSEALNDSQEKILHLENRTPEDDAYIYCSSGTTSEPKMITLPYAGIVPRIMGIINEMQINANDDVIMSFCDFGFDASLCEILIALFSGAQLVIAPQYVRKNPLDNLPRYLQTKPAPKPTATILIPSILRFITDTKPYFPLQKILTTGEKCLIDWLKPLMAQGWEFWNGYGPTETTFGVTTTKIKPNDKMISLHKESMGLKLTLIQRNDLSIEAGDNQCEVLIEGSGIGYYKNSTEKNNQCFKDLAEIGTKQFKTGDLVNVHSEDAIEFTRRIDSRRKIFGEQIDLAQISKVIEKYSAIQKAELEVHDNTLIAFIQIKADSQFDPQAYEDHLNSHPDLKGKHRPSFSFTCKSASNPKPPYHYISTIRNAEKKMNSNHKSTVQKIEQIWKDILLIGLSQELLDLVTLNHQQSFTNLGGNSVTVSLMATKVWSAFNADPVHDKNWSRFFSYVMLPDCTIDSLALYILIEKSVQLLTPKLTTTAQHLERNSIPEQPLVIIREYYYSDKRVKPIKKINNVPIYHALIMGEWLPEDIIDSDGDSSKLLHTRLLLLLDQIKCTRKVILIDDDSRFIELTQNDTKCKTINFDFRSEDIDNQLASIVRKHQIKSLHLKLDHWRKKWLNRGTTNSKIKIKLNNLQKINEVIGPPGSGKSDIIVNILNANNENLELIPLDLTNKATIAEALLDLELSDMEMHYLKNLDGVLLIDNAELKIFTSETAHEPILLDLPKMKILFFTRQDYQYLHQENAAQNPLSGKSYQQFKLPANISLNLGFYDNQFFKHLICNDNELLTADNLISALENWFEYDFKRHFQKQPSPIEFQQFITTLQSLERDYLREGIALCFEPSFSLWNNTQYYKHSLTTLSALRTHKEHFKHALAALPYIEHIKPLLICTDQSKCLYSIPNVWLKILSITSLSKKPATPKRAQTYRHFNVLNMETEKNRQFLESMPAAYQDSIKQLSYVSGAPNVFIVYPLTGDIPRQFHSLKNHLDSYNCYAIYMHDVSFNDVANGRSHDLPTRAAFCVKVIRFIQNKGPYIIAGWSFGVLLSYLISKQILSEGEEIACIINIDGGPPPVNLQTNDQVARATHLICDLANRYQLCCADELVSKISTIKFDKLDSLFNFSQGVLREHAHDSNVALFSQHLQNTYDNIISFYTFFFNSVKLQKLPIKMLLLSTDQKLPFINDNVEMENWSEFLTIDDRKQFEKTDHFSILCSEAYQFINSYIQRTVPSQSLENVQFMTPLDFVIKQKQLHLARAAQQFKKLKLMNKGPVVHDDFLEPTQSTTALSTDSGFEECYHHLRFHKLEISDVSQQEGPLFAFTVIKQLVNSDPIDATPTLVHAIHGISGSGKSMICEQIELDFLNDFNDQTSLWLPIRLPTEAFHSTNLINLSQTLQVNLKYLIAHDQAKLLFIIDNYDEGCIEFIKNVLIYNQSSKIKFLITGTHDLLDTSFKSLYKVRCYKLAIPSVDAIQDYCEMHQKHHDPTHHNVYGELEEILNNNPIMRQLLNTPRNIRQLLPYINLISIHGLNDEFSIYNLSMKLFFSNIEYHTKQPGVRIRPGLDLKKTSLQYAKELSFAIATKDNNIEHFNNNDADTQALKHLCRVSFSNYSASFESPLFYHLQLANYLLDALKHSSDAFLTFLHIDLAPLTLTLDFMAEFIREHSTHSSEIISNLLEIVFRKNSGQPASNALSILGRCYHNLGGLYFTNLQFNRANLDGVILDGSYMNDCSLNNINLSRTSIRHCTFNNTDLTDSTLSSFQIETEIAPTLIMLSHNGKYLAYLMHHNKSMTLKMMNLHGSNCVFSEEIHHTGLLDKASCLFTSDDQNFILILHDQIVVFDLLDEKTINYLKTTTNNNSCVVGIFSSLLNDNSLIIGKSYEDGSLELNIRTSNPSGKTLFENSITHTSINEQLSTHLSKDEVMINPCAMLGLNGWIFTPESFILLPLVSENEVKIVWTNHYQNIEVSAMSSKNQFCLIATIINNASVMILKLPANDTVYCETTKIYHGIYQLQFAFDATILIGTTHSSLLVWDVETGALLENFPTHHNEVMNFTVAENAQLIAYTVYECANKINIFKVTQHNQPKQQEKFIAIAADGRYSLWQIASQRYQLRVNGGRMIVPIELNSHAAPITHKQRPLIAYKIGTELIVQCFDRANSYTSRIITRLVPTKFINDKFLALADFSYAKQFTAIYDFTKHTIISPQTTMPNIHRFELAQNQLICYETPQTKIKWQIDLQSHYTAQNMVISADEELIAISFPNGRIHIFSGHDGNFLYELVITYLSFNYLKDFDIHITQQHDIIITDNDNHQWYWRNKQMIWSATPASTHTATGALLDHQSTHNPSLNQRLTFFGAQHANQPLTSTPPSQNELLLVILQRFYGVGIHAKIKNIQCTRDESNLTITVDDVYEDRIIYLPKTVASAAIPQLDLATIGLSNNIK